MAMKEVLLIGFSMNSYWSVSYDGSYVHKCFNLEKNHTFYFFNFDVNSEIKGNGNTSFYGKSSGSKWT